MYYILYYSSAGFTCAIILLPEPWLSYRSHAELDSEKD